MNRLFKEGLVTTIVGLAIILASVCAWLFVDAPIGEVGTIAGLGSGLLFMKDKHIGIK